MTVLFILPKSLLLPRRDLLLYYLYCLCKSVQRSLVSRLLFFSESGCKGKNFKAYLPNIFGSFFIFSFFSFLVVSLVEREAKRKRKKKTGHRFLKEECQLALLSFSKAGAKVRTLKHNFQMFRKFFFIFLFQGRSSERNLWQRREKWKLTAPFYCQNVKTSPPSFPKADAKVGLLRTSAKYIQAFFEGLRELFHN